MTEHTRSERILQLSLLEQSSLINVTSLFVFLIHPGVPSENAGESCDKAWLISKVG